MSSVVSANLVKIDVMRGVAILMVIAFHSLGAVFGTDRINLWDAMSGTVDTPGEWFWISYVLRLGYVGVPLFFVISGYVIHRSCLLDARFTWRKYFGRRFWRIYPAYFLTLAGFALFFQIDSSWDFVLHSLLLHNFSWHYFFGVNPSFWSLAVEVQLYLLYPLALFVRARAGFGAAMGMAVLTSLAWRLAAFAVEGWPEKSVTPLWAGAIALWPDWLLGAWMAERHLAGGRLIKMPVLTGGIGALLFVLGEFYQPLLAVQFTAGSLVAAVVLENYLRNEGKVGFLAAWCAKVGVVSYSLYLIHQPFMWHFNEFAFRWLFENPFNRLWLGFPIYALVMVGVATVMYFVVEKNGVRLGNYFRNRKLIQK